MAKTQALIIHAGHYKIHKGKSAYEAAQQMRDMVSKYIEKKTPSCNITNSTCKNGFFRSQRNNFTIESFNEQLPNLATELDGLSVRQKGNVYLKKLEMHDISKHKRHSEKGS